MTATRKIEVASDVAMANFQAAKARRRTALQLRMVVLESIDASASIATLASCDTEAKCGIACNTTKLCGYPTDTSKLGLDAPDAPYVMPDVMYEPESEVMPYVAYEPESEDSIQVLEAQRAHPVPHVEKRCRTAFQVSIRVACTLPCRMSGQHYMRSGAVQRVKYLTRSVVVRRVQLQVCA